MKIYGWPMKSKKIKPSCILMSIKKERFNTGK